MSLISLGCIEIADKISKEKFNIKVTRGTWTKILYREDEGLYLCMMTKFYNIYISITQLRRVNVYPQAQISYDQSDHLQHLKVNNTEIRFPVTSLPRLLNGLDVMSICSAAADWSRNYVGYLGCF